MSTVFDIDASQDALQAEAQATCEESAVAIVDGRQVVPAILRDAMVNAGRSRVSFKEHLERLRDRKGATENFARADELKALLGNLKAEADAAQAALESEEAAHRERMRPLRSAAHDAAAAYESARHDERTLRSEAVQTLNSTMAPEARHEFNRLSNRRVRLQQRLQSMQAVVPDRAIEFRQVEARIEELRAIVAHQQKFQAGIGNTTNPKTAAELQQALERREELLKFNRELLAVEVEHLQAVADAEAWERTTFLDWRRMAWD